jgi:putative transcriptional regulator
MARVIQLKIKELMESRGLNQKEFAALCEIRPQTVSELARNIKVQIDLRTLQKICDKLNIDDPNDLFSIDKK